MSRFVRCILVLASALALAVRCPAQPVPVEREEFLRGRFVRDIDIAGTVLDEQGEPMEGVRIIVDVAGGGIGHKYDRIGHTGADGAFACAFEPTDVPRQYRIVFTPRTTAKLARGIASLATKPKINDAESARCRIFLYVK